ncbi:MAG: heat-inducible transcriptional repressor HrcA [Eubacterium sp.]|nr:heat-inducible transcriptional repressor HrcA [Eubacterium sp.]
MNQDLEYDLDDRKQTILRVIISNYLETGEPVGSRTISKLSDLNLSSATIRNEMSDLEELGYLVQPHTSAGRIPTDKGYRFYVDKVMTEKSGMEEAVKEREGALLERVDKLEALLMQVAKVLAYNTQYATMVTTPMLRNRQVKFIQLSQVDEERLVAVIVVGDNVAKNKLIKVSRPLINEEVLKFNLLLNTFLQGVSVDQINLELMQTMKKEAGDYSDILESIFEGIIDAVKEAEEMKIYTSGASNILRFNELGDVSKATALLETFEEQTGLNELADETLKSEDSDHNIQIYIGDEAPVQNMKDCSIVTSTYQLPEGAKGTIGIIGPKRMDYRKVVSTLKNLTDELDNIFRYNDDKRGED